MFEEQSDRYIEFGVESIPPDDDFAMWETRKRWEHTGRSLAQIVKQGLINIEK